MRRTNWVSGTDRIVGNAIKVMASKEESVISTFNLDEKAFYRCCNRLLQHSGVIRDGWSWAEVKGKEGYIKKTAVIPGRSCSLFIHKADDEMNDLTGADELENEVVGPSTECEDEVIMHYEYHVLYSFSHQVPVLYFRACTLDGQPLSLDEVWSSIHPNYKQRLLQKPWDTLTQQEHPFLGQPFFMLHPCHTEEFMRPLLKMAHAKKRKVNYIATWLSVVGPVVGLDVPLSYHTALIAPD